MAELRVLGLDACPGGWAGMAWDGASLRPLFATSVTEAVGACWADGGLDVVGIDIPIGLPDSSVRTADLQARGRLGRRASSVFLTPARGAVLSDTYEEANRLQRESTGQGLSRQAYALQAKILEVDAFVGAAPCRVVEVHPELSFLALGGRSLPGKRTWAGMSARRRLLADSGLVVRDDVGELGARANTDDVLDAAAVAWTAWRVATGLAASLPAPPEQFSDGWPAAIWV